MMLQLILIGLLTVGGVVTGAELEDSTSYFNKLPIVSLKNVTVLTFKAGEWTQRQRTNSTPQLTCFAGCFKQQVTAVQCKNAGWDGYSVNWTCEAQLRAGLTLEGLTVRCEAMPEGNRENITVGSCGLEYALGSNNSSQPKFSLPTVRLRDVPELTFRAGQWTSRQRTQPIPQLRCINGCDREQPRSVQCRNQGWDGRSVNWKCEAVLRSDTRLENTTVRCESFPAGNTEYATVGSCGLEYSLGRNDSGSRATVRLRDVQVLTFKAGQWTNRVRTAPLPQLICTAGCYRELPTAVQCRNRGWNGFSVNWVCEAQLRVGVRLANTNVRCESSPAGDRENIIAGSCALEYALQ